MELRASKGEVGGLAVSLRISEEKHKAALAEILEREKAIELEREECAKVRVLVTAAQAETFAAKTAEAESFTKLKLSEDQRRQMQMENLRILKEKQEAAEQRAASDKALGEARAALLSPGYPWSGKPDTRGVSVQ